jgi:hypothetical protein
VSKFGLDDGHSRYDGNDLKDVDGEEEKRSIPGQCLQRIKHYYNLYQEDRKHKETLYKMINEEQILNIERNKFTFVRRIVIFLLISNLLYQLGSLGRIFSPNI